MALRVPPTVFLPRPEVESAVAVIDRIRADPLAPAAIRLAAAGFGQRRKMLRRSLAGVLADPAASLERRRDRSDGRAEELRPGDYLRLAEVLNAG